MTTVKYDPNQPRDPGGEDGGQWIAVGGGGGWEWDDDAERESLNAPDSEVELSAKERESINRYTGGAYRELNTTLREGGTLTPEQEDLRQDLEASIAKSGTLDKPVTVWRGIKVSPRGSSFDSMEQRQAWFTDKFTPGKEITMAGFQSSSFFTEPAMDASNTGKDGPGGVVFEIRTRHGVSVSKISRFDDEAEWLMGHNRRYRVRKVVKGVTFLGGFDNETRYTRTVIQVEALD